MTPINKPFNTSIKKAIRPQLAALLSLLLLAGCTVGPKYQKPTVDSPAAYKELTPKDYPQTEGWKTAQPSDAALKGKWWQIFNDPQLNALEDQINVSNQNVAAATSAFLASRSLVREARSQYWPTVTTSPSITQQRASSVAGSFTAGGTGSAAQKAFTTYSLPFDATWQPDLFGRVRNNVRAAVAGAQVSDADLENIRLTAQAQLASEYFSLRGQDALKQLLDSTVVAFQESLDLTKVLYDTGISSDEAVAQAETQLETTRAQATAVEISRAQFEHAIAVLIGQPPSAFSIPSLPLDAKPPAIPFGVPSDLLEHRPDIAAAERTVAQANAQIGLAKVAYYPTLTLAASAGFTATTVGNWFTWPARFFAVGPTLAQTLFDGGLRRATVQQFRAQYDEQVANYRQTVLTAFQQVEDNLSGLRILSVEIGQQDRAVSAANRNLTLAVDRYKLGIDPYLNVLTAQTLLLGNQVTAVNLRVSQMTTSVLLIEALGGSWDTSQLAAPHEIISQQPLQNPSQNPAPAPSTEKPTP
jgi:NodT family efflux transporter outer membrane factor (OMF) lipoprotein